MTESTGTVSPPLPPDPTSKRNSLAPVQTEAAGVAPPRSRAASTAQPVLHQPQPIREVVDKAFDDTIHQSPVDSHIDPTLIAKITEQVVKQLREQGIGNALPQPTLPPSPPHVPAQPKRWSADSLKRRSPSVTSEQQHNISKTRSHVTSPEPPLSGSEFDNDGGYQSQAIEDDTESTEAGSRPDADYRYQGQSIDMKTSQPRPDSSVRWSRNDRSAEMGTRARRDSSNHARSNPVIASPPTEYWDDMTAVEKAWKQLFDRAGNPLPRLGHFLRGLALHLIDDYEPKCSLVVTPAKMQRFFEETKLDDEQYPWLMIFSKDISCQSLSKIYQQLQAQHHLVQTANHSMPTVPALTPHGFECFMTCLIQAHPDQEYRRLSEVVKHMPVSSAEDQKFRFPKELSRRLLPSRANVQAAQKLTASMAHESKIVLRNSVSMPPPPPPPQQADRERKPKARRSDSNAFEDDDTSTTVQLERERKPYIAKEGSGKIHDRDTDWTNELPADPPRPIRQNSGSSGAPAPNRNRLSTGPGTAPPLSYNNFARSSGRRSPPLSSSYSQSEVGVPSDPMHPGARAESEVGLDNRRSSRRRAQSSSNQDYDPRGKPIPGRSGLSQGSDSGYGGSMPPPLPPLGTSFTSQRSNQSSYDERRRSAYSAGPTTSDGWMSNGQGSFGSEAGR